MSHNQSTPAVAIKNVVRGILIGLSLLATVTYAPAQDDEMTQVQSLDWQQGPCTAKLDSIAEIRVPEGCNFVASADAIKLLELMGNPTDGSELGLLASEDFGWFVTFEFDDIGYVKDDDKDDLDQDALLDSIRHGTEEGNKIRRQRGWPTMEILGWEHAPHYDSATRNLVWAIRGRSEGELVVNYNTRRLGRSGVMNITLVVDPQDLDAVIPEFNSLMRAYNFASGNRYDEFRVGDKVAKYGLAALVTGGAAAVAVKSGLLKWLWKAIVVGVLAISGAIKALFKRK